MSRPERKPNILSISYPLRSDFIATVQVPRDITKAEADRLCAMIRTLPIPTDEVENDG